MNNLKNKNFLIYLILFAISITLNMHSVFSLVLLIFSYINYKFSGKLLVQKIMLFLLIIIGIASIVASFYLKPSSNLAFCLSFGIVIMVAFIQLNLSNSFERIGRIKKTENWYERIIYCNIYILFNLNELLFDELEET